MTPRNETCARPGCTLTANTASDGLCTPHRRAAGLTAHPTHLVTHRLTQWLDEGHTINAIRRHCGVGAETVQRILRGDQTTIYTPTARKILHAPAHIPPARPASLPIIRRVRALAAAGWTLRALETETGIQQATLARVRQGIITLHTKPAMAATIRAHYDRLALLPVRPITKLHRIDPSWRTPMGWDDGELDQLPPHWNHILNADPGSELWEWGRTYQRLDTGWADVARHHGKDPHSLRNLLHRKAAA